jgi:F0F1-type ATP synthase membrane subunit b/b'
MEHHAVVLTPGLHELFSLINIGIVIAVVVIFARKGIAESFKSRSQKIRDELVQTREELKSIKQDIEKARLSLSAIEKEKADLIKKVEEEGRTLARRLVDEAKVSATAIREDSERAATAEFADMRAKLKAELLNSIVKKVQDEFAGEGSKQKLHDKLVDGFLSREATQ